MVAKYIFIKKEDKKSDKQLSYSESKAISRDPLTNPVLVMVKKLFKHIEDNVFSIDIEGINYKFTYLCTKRITAGYFIKIEARDYTPAVNAKILNRVNNVLTKGSHRKDFNIISSYDEASEYYCEKIFPKFNTFERKMRNLIFNILLEAFGVKWADEAISDEIKEDLKSKGMSQSELIEEALHEFTIFQLEKLLFEAFRDVELSKLIDEDLSVEKIKELEKEQIVDIILKGRPKSIWERYFEGKIIIENLENNLSVIRKYRNSVAHHKYFSSLDYIKCRKLLGELIKDLDNAIELTEIEDVPSIDMTNIVAAFANMMENIQYIGQNAGVAMQRMSEVLSNIELPKIQFDFNIIKQELVSGLQKDNFFISHED